MAKRTAQLRCPHDNKDDKDKAFWMPVGNVLLSDKAAAWMTQNEEKVTVFLNMVPGASYHATFKDWGDDEGGGKKGKW